MRNGERSAATTQLAKTTQNALTRAGTRQQDLFIASPIRCFLLSKESYGLAVTSSCILCAGDSPQKMDQLPADALAVVFEHLNAADCLRMRGVCQEWNTIAASGCGHIVLVDNVRHRMGRVHLVGYRAKVNVDKHQQESRIFSKKRTRGHLPEPCVMEEETEHTSTSSLEVVATGFNSAALRIDHARVHEDYLQSLDLAASMSQLRVWQFLEMMLPPPGSFHKPEPLRRALREVDLSGLCRLGRLSVRGCSNLRILRLPMSLKALDASACGQLRLISMPNTGKLTALNLNGCGELQQSSTGLFGSLALEQTRELNMSSTTLLPKPLLAGELRMTTRLVSLSLRYIATDEVLVALAASTSARETIRWVDTAFSTKLTDAAVEALVQAAPKLERLNLRGCRSVSVGCYNHVPILLEKRRKGLDQNDATTDHPGAHQKRKGDNVFFFTASTKRSSKSTKGETFIISERSLAWPPP